MLKVCRFCRSLSVWQIVFHSSVNYGAPLVVISQRLGHASLNTTANTGLDRDLEQRLHYGPVAIGVMPEGSAG